MENRRDLSEKSKKLIAKHFNSDILNKSTGYYKTEHIYPIASKPNELKIKLEKFVPNFKEEKAVERHFNDLLSEKQRNNSFILKYKKLLPYKNEELEIERKRNKTIKDNCYDKKGKFSSRRRFILEFYGIEKLNNNFEYGDINTNNNIIKNERDTSKEEEKENKNINRVSGEFNNLKRKKFRELILKSRNLYNNYDNENDSIIKNNNEEKFNTVNNNIENNSFVNNFNENKYNKITRNKNQQDNLYNNISSYTNKEIFQNTINNIIKPKKLFNRLRIYYILKSHQMK